MIQAHRCGAYLPVGKDKDADVFAVSSHNHNFMREWSQSIERVKPQLSGADFGARA